MKEVLQGLFAAHSTQYLRDRGAPTGIFKTPIERACVDENGIQGDIQADKSVHGGVEKALHQYAQPHYAHFKNLFPDIAAAFCIGSMGENLSTAHFDEKSVYIGDVFALGDEVVIQVSQPRQPCWKINSKYGDDGIVKEISRAHLNGWYYRVLQGGTIRIGDALSLLTRPNNVAIYTFLATVAEHRPSLTALERLAACEGLTPKWQTKLVQRIESLTALERDET